MSAAEGVARRAILAYATPRSGGSTIERRGEAPARTRERGGVNVSSEVRRAVLEHAARGWVTGTLLVCTRRRRHMKCEGRTSAARRVRGSQASAREESAPQGNKTPLQRGSKIQDIYSKQARRTEHGRKNYLTSRSALRFAVWWYPTHNHDGTYTASSTARGVAADKRRVHANKRARPDSSISTFVGNHGQRRMEEEGWRLVLRPGEDGGTPRKRSTRAREPGGSLQEQESWGKRSVLRRGRARGRSRYPAQPGIVNGACVGEAEESLAGRGPGRRHFYHPNSMMSFHGRYGVRRGRTSCLQERCCRVPRARR